MMRRIRFVEQLMSGARAARERVGRKHVARVVARVAATVCLVGLAGCYGWGNRYYAGGGGGNYDGSNALWVANGTNVVEFLPSQLTNGTIDPAPHVAINSSMFGAPQGVVFDNFGDLWVIDGGTVSSGGKVAPALYEFTVKQLENLSTNAAPAPAVTITSTSFVFPQQAAFDYQGNLWVTDNGSNEVYAFKRSQLNPTAVTAALTPTETITSSTAFNGPIGIAFDYAGDLYVANNGGNTIYGFKASTLPNLYVGSVAMTPVPTPTALTPTVTLSSSSNSIQGPWGLAFDGYGDLWSSNANAPNTVVEFTRSQTAATGSPTPNITLASATVSSNATLVAPNGIAFDNYGDLAAVSSAAPFGVAGFGPDQFGTNPSAPLTPDLFLVGSASTLNAPAGVVFGPSY